MSFGFGFGLVRRLFVALAGGVRCLCVGLFCLFAVLFVVLFVCLFVWCGGLFVVFACGVVCVWD